MNNKTPETLKFKSELFLKKFIGSNLHPQDLHLLMDIVKLNEHPTYTEGNKKCLFDYFIFKKDDERDNFFDNFHEHKQYYEPFGRLKKLSLVDFNRILGDIGIIVPLEILKRYTNPVKVKIRNRKYLQKHDIGNRS
jgi:hypothetical protein